MVRKNPWLINIPATVLPISITCSKEHRGTWQNYSPVYWSGDTSIETHNLTSRILVCFWLYRYRPFCKKKNRKFAVNANYLPWFRKASAHALRLHCDFKWHFFFILQSKLSSVSLLVSFHNQRITKWTSKIDRFCSALEANNQMNFKYTIIIINYK